METRNYWGYLVNFGAIPHTSERKYLQTITGKLLFKTVSRTLKQSFSGAGMSGMNNDPFDMGRLKFQELEERYGHENACAILRSLEQFEGVMEEEVARFSWQDRLSNVFELMKEGLRFQTRH